MYKYFLATILALVTFSGADAKKHHGKVDMDKVYSNDIIDTRAYTHGLSAFYIGFMNEIYGEDTVSDDCLGATSRTALQDLIHKLSHGQTSNMMKLMTDGEKVLGGYQNCDFIPLSKGVATHCIDEPKACDINRVSKRATKKLGDIVEAVQDLIQGFVNLDPTDEDELAQNCEDIGAGLGGLFGTLLDF